MKILWIAPNLNHYKYRFLTRLKNQEKLDLTILAGQLDPCLGHVDDSIDEIDIIKVAATKVRFQYSFEVYSRLMRTIRSEKHEFVLMPSEVKHIFMIFFLSIIKRFYSFSLITYTHPLLWKNHHPVLRRLVTKLIFKNYDHVIFYTEQAMEKACSESVISIEKAGFANNTLDTSTIWNISKPKINKSEPKALLFIGRLKKDKWFDQLESHYKILTKTIPSLELIMIGDGPERSMVKDLSRRYSKVSWCGAIVNENKIATIMQSCHAIFVPGHSGLSIVHGFAYGKPYITMGSYNNHPPEFSYIVDNWNGLILGENLQNNCDRILRLLLDGDHYEKLCRHAIETARSISIDKWCNQIQKNLTQTLSCK